MSTLPPCHHPPLPSPHHIRLLELLSSSDRGAPLTGTMRVVNIVDDDVNNEETLPYVALSYTWVEDAGEELLLDGKGMICISQYLGAALRRFRYASALRWIWVDAICINQEDNAEKSIQIPLMAQIYRNASRVMVWLGNEAENDELLRRIKSLVRDAKVTPQATEATELLIASLRPSISLLGKLKWFTRRWVLQEFALNANAVLCCGQTELPWPQLVGVLGYSDDDYEQQRKLLFSNEEDAGPRNIRLLWELWLDITTISPWTGSTNPDFSLKSLDIAALMDTYSDFKCSDGQDLIAALLGLSCDAQGPTAFRVDYADPVEQTYVKFAETLMRTGHMAWLLYQRFQRENERASRGTNLPSWVPDWRLPMVAPQLDWTFKYLKCPASGIQASHTTYGVHLLTTHFWRLPFAERESRKSLKSPDHTNAPAFVSPPFMEIIWKSSSFPEDSSLDERMALVLVDLWPRMVARFGEDAKTARRKMWCALLLQVAYTLLHGRCTFGSYTEYSVSYDELPTFGEDDVSDLEALRRYTRSWVQKYAMQHNWMSGPDSKGPAECLVFCQEASDCLNIGSVCGMGCVPSSFYNQVMVGDKVLLANLGHFRKTYPHTLEVGMVWSRYIVREKHVAPEEFAGLALDGQKSTKLSFLHGTNSCYNHGSKSKLVSPWVYEFVAPCQAFNSFPWMILLLTNDPPDWGLDAPFFAEHYSGNGVKDSDSVRSILIR